MKIVVYSFMEIEKQFYTDIEEKLGVELLFCNEMPTLENAKLAKGVDAISVITTPISAELIEYFHKLGVKYISTRNIGYDHIDIKKAKEIGMGVGNSSYSPSNVAEYAVMLLLMSTRKGGIISEAYKKQDYTLDGKMGLLLQTSTVGVIGTGKIGSAVINMLSGFGCKILAYDPFQNESIKKYAEYVSLEILFEKSDVITLHAPSTEENMHLINKDTISKMKNGVIIVNTARGALIDTDALIDGLASGKIGFAALDVLEGEGPVYYKNFEGQPTPLESISRLNQFPNVLLTPHTAFFTKNAFSEMVQNSMKSCVLEIKGKENPWKIV